ncbi:MAG: histidine--tRNA ligase [Desulfofustis sp. PB-SRB1]|jgi:histidyl-tRNA synthetase|nr:histidine--tRNA ligase [Desulfofustis sp. PB-SRB1]MBM1002339.1 histidine--tRNA ligase [Desulfofustis sp. PB-SRB1]HBH29239.1 histidine--tRNA ligase [Desulfofustis sp.]HBH30763.1 histidine--tRNA ligase [Desulfofustis sp.]
MGNNITALQGFKDIVPADIALWREVEECVREVVGRFQCVEIRLPILEASELFIRSIGEQTDIVEKEMYTFVDKKVTIRPEATASLLRAYIEHRLHLSNPVQRFFTIGPMFRHERPQKGRLRQFHQADVEFLGSDNARVDAELLAMGAMIFALLAIPIRLELNSLGCPVCRPPYRGVLVSFLQQRLDFLCEDCRRRSVTNPLRVLDCKKEKCRAQLDGAPALLDYLCEPCRVHFTQVRTCADGLGLDYHINTAMVRGLDYYVRTTFEFVTDELGSQAAVCAGGRYDGLIEMLGGGPVPGIGFALGLERTVLLLRKHRREAAPVRDLDLFIAALGDDAAARCFTLMHTLRTAGLRVNMGSGSLKSQMKQADRAGAPLVIICGENELAEGKVVLRDMATKQQEDVELQDNGILLRLRQLLER